jgi:hypothetical protein
MIIILTIISFELEITGEINLYNYRILKMVSMS